MEESNEVKEEEKPKEGAKVEDLTEMVKTLKSQEERIDAKAIALDKRELAFNAKQREAKLSGKSTVDEKGKTAEELKSDARIKKIGEATGAQWAKNL